MVVRNSRSSSKSSNIEIEGGKIRKQKILIVEDETIVAMEIQSRLEEYKYEVVGIASSGEKAIEKVEETLPDLVLMDIVLKGDLDGIEIASQIRSRFNIPVVYLTAYADEETLQRAKITGPFGYILKPFEDRELRSNIEIALCRSRMENKLRESRKWLAATIDSIGEGVIATDREGIIKVINPFAEALTGWKQEECMGKPIKKIFKVVNKDTDQRVEDPVKKVIQEGSFYGLAGGNILVTKEGIKIPIDIIGLPIKDDEDSVIGIVIVFYDIVERKNIEKEIQKYI